MKMGAAVLTERPKLQNQFFTYLAKTKLMIFADLYLLQLHCDARGGQEKAASDERLELRRGDPRSARHPREGPPEGPQGLRKGARDQQSLLF